MEPSDPDERRGADAVFTTELITNAAGTYWQSHVNSWSQAAWTSSELKWSYRFGFELEAGGTGDRLDFSSEPGHSDGDAVPNERFLWRDYPQTWELLDGTVHIKRTQLCNGEPCMWREWILLDASADNGRLYMLEKRRYRNADTAPGVYLEDKFFPPRWNFYDRWAIPAADVFN